MYHYKEVKLGKGKQAKGVLVIEFEDPSMKVVGEFLMADGTLLGETVLREMSAIEQGEKEQVQLSGNRCGLTIAKDKTILNDLLAGMYEDVTGLPDYAIETSLFKDILVEWLQVRKEYYNK